MTKEIDLNLDAAYFVNLVGAACQWKISITVIQCV